MIPHTHTHADHNTRIHTHSTFISVMVPPLPSFRSFSTCLCVCVCVCVCAYIHVHLYIKKCMNICMSVYMYTHTHTQAHTHIHNTQTHTSMHACLLASLSTFAVIDTPPRLGSSWARLALTTCLNSAFDRRVGETDCLRDLSISPSSFAARSLLVRRLGELELFRVPAPSPEPPSVAPSRTSTAARLPPSWRPRRLWSPLWWSLPRASGADSASRSDIHRRC